MEQNQSVRLKAIGLLVLEPTEGGMVVVHSFGAEYTEPPTCRESVDAALAWAAAIDRGKTAAGTSLSPAEYIEAAAHLRAFVDAIGSAYFWRGCMPEVIAVPGLGRWTFSSQGAEDLNKPR